MSAVPLATSPATRVSRHAGVPVYAALALGVFALWPALASLVQYWREIPDYEHGFLVAAVSALWLAMRYKAFDGQDAEPRPWALLPLAALLALWWIALRGISHMAFQLLVPPILWVAVFAAAGPRAARLAAAPIAYFYFAIPAWDYLVPVLQHGTVWAAETGMGAIGVATKVTGNVVTIPEGTFVVEDACSGERYFLVALAFAGLLGPIYRLSAPRQIILFLLAVATAIVGNWIRVLMVIYAGHVTHMQHSWVQISHIALGNEIFAVLLVFLLLGAWRLARPPIPRAGESGLGSPPWMLRQASRPLPRAGEGGGEGARRNDATEMGHSSRPESPASRRRASSPGGKWAPAALFTASGLLVSAFPAAPQAGPSHLGEPPVLTGRWNGPLPAHADWQPDYRGAADTLQVSYDGKDGRVDVYVNLFTNQTPDRKLIKYGNSILTPEEWVQTAGPRWQDAFAGSFGATPLTAAARTRSGERWVLAYGYVVAGHRTASAVIAQLEAGAASLFGPTGSGVLAVAARCADPACGNARRAVRDFWNEESSRFASLVPRHVPRAPTAASLPANGVDRP